MQRNVNRRFVYFTPRPPADAVESARRFIGWARDEVRRGNLDLAINRAQIAVDALLIALTWPNVPELAKLRHDGPT